MKNFKKFAAMVSALALASCAVAPVAMNAFATQVSVNVTNDSETHTYKAYEIFQGTYDATLGLTVTGWGAGIDVAKLLADSEWSGFIVEDAVEAQEGTPAVVIEGEEGYVPAKPAVEGKAAVTIGAVADDATGAATAAQKIEKIASDSTKADALAKVIAKYITGPGTSLNNTAVDLGAGYYIVTDTYTSSDKDGGKSDSISKHILRVSGESTPITITPKKDKPTVSKKVWENQNANVQSISAYTAGGETEENWNDVADYSIGDEISFKLYGTLPSNLNDYTNGYRYVFHDTIDSQFDLVLDTDDQVDVTVYVNGVIANDYNVSTSGNSFTVTWNNILNGRIISNPESALVTVEYKAKLNANANIGKAGQENQVYLEYSNNPNWDGEGVQTTDETPRDEVVVFTYGIDNTKVDGATNAKLSGAKFRLKNSAGNFAKVTGSGGIYKFNGWSESATIDTLLTSADTTGKFNIVGLDEGTYSIIEVSAPVGYNALSADVPIVVTASTANGHSYSGTPSDALTKFDFTYNDEAGGTQTGDDITGIASGNIANNKGTTLPGTGGIGTTLFYLGGGTMVAVAGVFLITKKRMGKREE